MCAEVIDFKLLNSTLKSTELFNQISKPALQAHLH